MLRAVSGQCLGRVRLVTAKWSRVGNGGGPEEHKKSDPTRSLLVPSVPHLNILPEVKVRRRRHGISKHETVHCVKLRLRRQTPAIPAHWEKSKRRLPRYAVRCPRRTNTHTASPSVLGLASSLAYLSVTPVYIYDDLITASPLGVYPLATLS